MADPIDTPANDVATPVTGAKRRKLRSIILKLALLLAIAAPLSFMIGALGAKFGLWDYGFGLGTLSFKVGPILLALSLLFGVISVIFAFIIKPRKGLLIGALAILIPLVGMAQIAKTRSTVATLPFIHDVTTDTQDVPTFGDVIMTERAVTEGVNSADYIGKRDSRDEELVSVLQTQAYPDIRSLVMDAPRDVAFGQALATAKSMGWEIKAENAAEGRVDATDTTFWYGFKDDVTIRLRDSEGGGTIVDVRSLSRVGGSDIGKNADRVREYLEALKAG